MTHLHFAFLSHPLGAYGQRTNFILGLLESECHKATIKRLYSVNLTFFR